VVAKLAVLANDSVGVGEKMISGADVRVEHDVRQQRRVISEHDIVGDDGIGPNMRVLADAGSRRDDGCGVNAGEVRGWIVEELDGAGEGQVRILEPEGGGGDLGEVGLDQDRGSSGGPGQGGVLLVGDEGDMAGGCVFDSGNSGDEGGGIAVEGGAEMISELGQREGGAHAGDCSRGLAGVAFCSSNCK